MNRKIYSSRIERPKEGAIMRPILEALLDNRILAIDKIILKNPEYVQVIHKRHNLEETFQKKLSGDDLKLLEKLSDLDDELGAIEAEVSFMYGFKLGAAIMQEMLDDQEELIRKVD
jgi:hypothetical protein